MRFSFFFLSYFHNLVLRFSPSTAKYCNKYFFITKGLYATADMLVESSQKSGHQKIHFKPHFASSRSISFFITVIRLHIFILEANFVFSKMGKRRWMYVSTNMYNQVSSYERIHKQQSKRYSSICFG